MTKDEQAGVETISTNLSPAEIAQWVEHNLPGAVVQESNGRFYLLTIHGEGASEEEVMTNALLSFREMRREGGSFLQLLDDIEIDLREQSGMSRKRHDSLQELVALASRALDAGIATKMIPWIMSPSYTRKLEELQRRIAVRLTMTAQNMQEREKAKHRAAQKFPRSTTGESVTFDRLSAADRVAQVRAYQHSQGH